MFKNFHKLKLNDECCVIYKSATNAEMEGYASFNIRAFLARRADLGYCWKLKLDISHYAPLSLLPFDLPHDHCMFNQ
jgi:hypothetical protein